jgi:hypothetical protein
VTETSHRTKRIRAVVNTLVATHASSPNCAKTTAVLTELVMDQLGHRTPGVGIVDRHEIRQALESLAGSGQLRRISTGEQEPTRGKFRGRYQRAVRGTVTWSLEWPARGTSAGETDANAAEWRVVKVLDEAGVAVHPDVVRRLVATARSDG